MKKLIVGAACLLSACSSFYVDYHTTPEAAIIQQQRDGKVLGRSPVRIEYKWDKKYVDQNGCLRLLGVKASWASGAIASSPEVILLCKGKQDYSYTVERPGSAPDYMTDLQNEVDYLAQLRANAQAKADREALLFLGLLSAGVSGYTSTPHVPPVYTPAPQVSPVTTLPPVNSGGSIDDSGSMFKTICFSTGNSTTDGLNKICRYNCSTGQAAITIRASRLCPATIEQ